jgi:hypothetical protein
MISKRTTCEEPALERRLPSFSRWGWVLVYVTGLQIGIDSDDVFRRTGSLFRQTRDCQTRPRRDARVHHVNGTKAGLQLDDLMRGDMDTAVVTTDVVGDRQECGHRRLIFDRKLRGESGLNGRDRKQHAG